VARILIIDDSRVIMHVAQNFLNRIGHEVLSAQDGLEGLRLAQSQVPDLVLLDLVLPQMDGYEVCQKLKQEEQTRHIPVIMLTSKSEPGDKVRGLESGAVDYVTKPFDEAELLARVNIHLRIKELYEALQEKNRQLQELANRDGLTGLYNHRYFYEQLAQDFLRAKRYHEPLSCLLFDIDFFKRCNDTYGHKIGDCVLQTVAGLIQRSIRDSDIAARYGGEEFAVILYHTPVGGAVQAAERIRLAVKDGRFSKENDAFQITISAGVASYPHSQIIDPSTLIEHADQALYTAKQQGRDRVVVYE
jgi:two-component system cell cycle response regulator